MTTTPAVSGDGTPETAPGTGSPPEDQPYRMVWNDAVNLRHLALSMVVCVAIGLPAYLVSEAVFEATLDQTSLAGGYALLVGLAGCVVGAAVCTKLFPPKRVLADDDAADRAEALEVLAAMGGTPESFAELPKDVQDEMRSLGLAPTESTESTESTEERR
ncbi:hypothetical protein [Saccharomonospora azurea]|uniref:hypothetical protein n=1 Tax=Saccharomonospora azurea TaxID=40988 RepID=UPI000309BF2E|nr:hypothetical protein [Saccharomonospora azurea]